MQISFFEVWNGSDWSDDDFFFFKQKTAYEIVSRDWSSDVCSSDLERKNVLANFKAEFDVIDDLTLKVNYSQDLQTGI